MTDANTAITGGSLVVGTITYACGDTVAVGLVISQDPVADTQVAPNSAVNYVVSLGKAVPDVLGLLPADANTAITGAGYTVGTITYAWSNTQPKGKVTSQNPAAGTCTPGVAVNYVISRGPQPANCLSTDPNAALLTTQIAQFNTYVTNLWDPCSWCAYPIGSGYQCHGDADGKRSSPDLYRVYTGDLSLVVAYWKKKMGSYPNGADPAADIDHKASSPDLYRVYTGDLSRVTTNWKRKDLPTTGGLPRNCPLTDTANNTYVKP